MQVLFREEMKMSKTLVKFVDSKEQAVYDSLYSWRKNKSKELGIPAYCVCRNDVLIKIAQSKTLDSKFLLLVMGEKLSAKFGEEIMGLFNDITKQSGLAAV